MSRHWTGRHRVTGLWKFRARVPRGERREFLELIRQAAVDPEIGEPVPDLPPGALTCPRCGGRLTEGPSIRPSELKHERWAVVDCASCGQTYRKRIFEA